MSRPIVLVLAGGISSRMWPLRDKLLMRFGPRSLLERHHDTLGSLGCERIIIVARPDDLTRIRALAATVPGDVRVVVQPEARGMADAILCARPALESFGEGALYVTQAHDVVEQRLHAEMLRHADQGGAAGLVAGARMKEYFPGGYLVLEGDRVKSVVEKPGSGNEPSDLVTLVAHVHASWLALAQTLAYESAHGGDDVYERALTSLMATSDYRVHVYDGRWQGLKYPWHVLDVMELLLELWSDGTESPGEGYERREPVPGRNLIVMSVMGAE
jgi:NDP-sugar pyrophosphorylase family protein